MENRTSVQVVLITLLALFSAAASFAGGDPEYESQPLLRATEIVPADLLSGPYHRVNEHVVCDGYMHLYRIESDFGPFEVEGDALLAVRVQEMQALARMNEISETDAFQGALVAAAKSPFVGAKNLIVHPVATVKGLPGGVARYFTGLYHKTKKGTHEAQEMLSQEAAEDGGANTSEADLQTAKKRTKSVIGYDSARRQLAWRLGVDPYSSMVVRSLWLFCPKSL